MASPADTSAFLLTVMDDGPKRMLFNWRHVESIAEQPSDNDGIGQSRVDLASGASYHVEETFDRIANLLANGY
jgi:hypothetical protein